MALRVIAQQDIRNVDKINIMIVFHHLVSASLNTIWQVMVHVIHVRKDAILVKNLHLTVYHVSINIFW